VTHYMNFRRRVASYEEFVRELESLLPNAILLLIRKKSNREPIGYAMAHTINPWDGWAAGGVHVDERYRLRGPGGEASLLFTDFLFRTFPLRRLITEVYEFADRILHMARAMGFEEAGFIPEHFWYDDRLWGVHQLVLTRDSWEDRRVRFADIVEVQREFHEEMALHSNGEGAVDLAPDMVAGGDS
jgi:RimJ/RimL family protein N-acetyltransferase